MSETVGELCTSHRSQIGIEWKIENFSSLPQIVDEFHKSPNFDFFGIPWCLKIYPNGQSQYKSQGWIVLYLHRHSFDPSMSVIYAFGLKMADGKKQEKYKYTGMFDVEKKGWGTINFLSRSELLRRKSELLPSDVLTITCSITFSDPQTDPVIRRTEKLTQDLKGLLLSGNDSDVTIKVKGEQFRVHRNILEARTPVFDSMFKHKMTEKATGIVSIDDCEVDSFRAFLQYVYTGTIENLSPENMFGLFEVADKYQVDELKEDCLKCIEKLLSVETFCDVIALAIRHNDQELMEKATDLLSDKMKDIIMTVKWQIFMSENPTQANELLIKSLAKKETK